MFYINVGISLFIRKNGNWIIFSYYNHKNSTIFKGLYFFMNNPFYCKEQKEFILDNFNRYNEYVIYY